LGSTNYHNVIVVRSTPDHEAVDFCILTSIKIKMRAGWPLSNFHVFAHPNTDISTLIYILLNLHLDCFWTRLSLISDWHYILYRYIRVILKLNFLLLFRRLAAFGTYYTAWGHNCRIIEMTDENRQAVAPSISIIHNKCCANK